MFDPCPLKGDEVCPHCTHANYNPLVMKYDEATRVFCGLLNGADTTIGGIEICILKMNPSKRRSTIKNKSIAIKSKRLNLGL